VTGGLDGEALLIARWHRDIDVLRIGGDAVDRSRGSPDVATDDADRRAVVVHDLGDVRRDDVLVAGRCHLERGGQICPQLKTVHPTLGVAMGHLLVDDAAARSHPLDIAGGDGPLVAKAVAMIDGTRQNISDRLDSPMGVPGETGQVVLRPLIAKVVEQQKRVEILGLAKSKGPLQVHPGTLDGRFCLYQTLYRSYGHRYLLAVCLPSDRPCAESTCPPVLAPW
jgi:hypothetical protein